MFFRKILIFSLICALVGLSLPIVLALRSTHGPSLQMILLTMVFPLSIVTLFGFIFKDAFVAMWSTGDESKIRETGIPGTAKVLKMIDTGMTVNTMILVKMQVEVSPSNNSTYQTEVKMLLPRLAVGTVVPGAQFPVRIDPKNPNRVVLAA